MSRPGVQDHEIHGTTFQQIENPARAIVRVIEKVEHCPGGVSKSSQEVDFRRIRAGINVPAPRLGANERDQ
jgi:hypothetical protein